MKSDSRGHWCIFYCKKTDITNWHVMKMQRSDGVLVSAKTYDEVFKFVKYIDAWNFAKKLLTEKPQRRYDVVIRKVSPAGETSFYLSGK